MEELLLIAERGYQVDPYLDPLVAAYSQALISAGEVESAVEVLDRAFARGGADWLNVIKLMALLEAGDTGAVRSLLSGLDISEENRSVFMAALVRTEDPGAREDLLRLRSSDAAREDGYFLFDMAEVLLLHLGHSGVVVDEYLEQFTHDGWGTTEYWFMPHFAGFRSHPRFAELLDQIGLPAYWDQAGWPEFCQRTKKGAIQCH